MTDPKVQPDELDEVETTTTETEVVETETTETEVVETPVDSGYEKGPG